jgi:hypothetical protein
MDARHPDLTHVIWLEPWEPAPAGLEAELAREVGRGHPLAGRSAVSVGRRVDCDDVLFFLPDGPQPFAVVHLTWSGRREASPGWPSTAFYSSAEDWAERRMKPDHLEYAGGEG